MATKKQEHDDPTSCFNKAFAEEPLFILRAQDLSAPGLVMQWANRAAKNGCPDAKVQEARNIAEAMQKWPVRKMPD